MTARCYHARWVVPIVGPPLMEATVAVHGGRIAYVGPRSAAPSGTDVELGDAVILPGLVNAHTHLELTLMRGFLENLAFRPWIVTLTKARQQALSRNDLLTSARVGIAEGLQAGITTYADTSESGVVLRAMVEMGVRGIMYQEVFGPAPEQCESSMRELRDKLAEHRQHETPQVRVGVSPHAPYTVSDALFTAVATLAQGERVPLAVHIAESADETEFVCRGAGDFAELWKSRGIRVTSRGTTPVELLERLGVLAVEPLLIHCVRVDAADIERITSHRCAVAHCPASNAKLGHGVAPIDALLRAGVRVGLGSDSVASNNRMDLLEEARLALLMQRAQLGRHDHPSATDVLTIATLGGARALGLDGEIGSLEVGKSADLAVFDLGELRARPVFDPVDALVYGISGRSASLVAVAGVELVRGGRLVSDLSRDIGRMEEAAHALRRFAREHVVG